MRTKGLILVESLGALLIAITVRTWAWHHPSTDLYAPTRLYYKNPRNVPSDLCPRDEAQAQLQGRSCLRKCTSDEDCKSKRKKCMCDGACGLSCIKPEKECLDPEPPLELGDVQASGKVFGSKATYTCPEGFKVIGMEERVCQADGTWSGTPPTCTKNIFCTEPPLIEHARHNAPVGQTTFDLDTSLMYQCLPGYTTKGFARTKCFFYNGTAKWFGPDITCEPKSCGDPPDILNGSKEKACIHVGCEITYVCQPGFELVGRAKHTCQPEGIWLPKDLPTCVPVHCPDLEHPANGKVMYTVTTFNSPATYECKYGYMLVGESTRRCGPNKRWSGLEPQCKEINCGSPGILYNGWLEGSRMTLHAVIEFHCIEGMTFEGENERTVCQSDGTWSTPFPKCQEINCGHPGQLPNGWLENIDKGTVLGASVIFRCSEGMTLVGHTSSLCQVDGRWRYPPPHCYAPCKIPVVAFGNITSRVEVLEGATINETEPLRIYHNPGATVPHGKSVDILCENRYEPSQSLAPPSCFNGTFTQAPRCQPARCKSLPRAPKHGMVIAPKTGHGMRARFTCKDGYTLVGHNVTECQYGDWIGETPNCIQVFCKFPGSIPNGRVLLVGNMGLYDYRNYVTKVANNRQIMFECDRGYVLADGPIGKTCIRGEWSPKMETPKCIPSQHPNFRWIRRRRRRSIGSKGSGAIAARNNNKGSGGGGGAGGGRRAKKRGKPGEEDEYDSGPWGCEPLDGEANLQSSVVSGALNENQTFTDGTVMRVSCVHGFELNMANDSIRCKNGAWKPKTPHCNALPCKTPYIQHGTFSDGNKTLYFQELVRHSKVVHYRCMKGYLLRGSSKLMCWYGEWDVLDIPECMPAPCKLLQIKHGAYAGRYRPGNIVIHGTELDYSCGSDFKKAEAGPVKCNLGEWKPAKPACFHPSSIANQDKQQEGNNKSSSNQHLFENYREYDWKNPKAGGESNKRRSVWLDLGIQTHLDSHSKRTCGRPPKEKATLVYLDGRPLDYEAEYSIPDSSEIMYRCANGKGKTKSRWKIICNDGTWTKSNKNNTCEGPHPTMNEIKELLKLINSTCSYNKEKHHVATFNNEQQLTKDHYDFPPFSTLISRCEDIGKFILKGATKRKCISGQWIGVTPKCEGLSQYHDLSLDKPPTILFRYHNGSIMQSSDGKLIVYPGTTVHMECLWIRKFGTPIWEISNGEREYPEGWAQDEGRDSTLEYRLSIENAETEDSGIYRCVTPARQAHQIVIIVKGVECPKLPENTELEFSTTDTKLGTKVQISCKSGEELVGAKEISCLSSGKWNAPFPRCKGLECPEIVIGADFVPLRYMSSVTNRSYERDEMVPPKVSYTHRFVGEKAVFSCPSGYMVQGKSVAVCQSSGQWTAATPTCVEVECRPPIVPKNGYIKGTPPHKISDTVQFECEHGYMMDGTPIATCRNNGKWSSSTNVKCLQACTYPGSIIGGKSSAVKFYYAVGEKVFFECDDNYDIRGTRMLQCLGSGKWSTSIPTCIPMQASEESNHSPKESTKQRNSKRTN